MATIVDYVDGLAGLGGGLVAAAVDGPGGHVGDASVGLDDQGVEEAA